MSYFDEVVKHNIKFSEYGLLLANDCKFAVSEILDKLNFIMTEYNSIVTKSQKKEAEGILVAKLAELNEELEDIMLEYLIEVINRENEWLAYIGERYLNIDFTFSERFEKLIKDYSFATAGTLGAFAFIVTDRIKAKYEGLLNSSYVMGTDMEDLIEDTDFETIERFTYNNAETIGSGLGNVYDRMVYTKNEDKLKKYQWIAILDTSTCAACGEMNGKVFDDLSKVPLYPVHQNCRCLLLPLVEAEVKEVPSYSEWIESQDEDSKKEILGKTRYSMYQNGMKISQFYANGRKINLKDLNK